MNEDEENLQQVIQSCIRCGNNISKHSLNRLSSSIRRWAEQSPNELLHILQTVIIEFDCQIVPTRILLSIINDLQNIPVSYFQPIIHLVIKLSSNHNQPASVIHPIHNAIFILPVDSLNSVKATELATNLINLLHDCIHQTESLTIIATALSHFLKKWADFLTNPEFLASSLFTLLSDSSFNYGTLSLLCQSVISIILSKKILGEANLKEIIDDLIKKKTTILDQCTSVSHLNFTDFILQTLPISAQYQLIATLIFDLPVEKLNQIAKQYTLLANIIKNPPPDELTQICFFTMLSAVLKATAKLLSPKALNMCCNALLANPNTDDNSNRRAMKLCFGYLLQCSAHTQNPTKFNTMLFQRIVSLSPDSVLRQDALPQIIPCASFSNITLDFFQYLLSLFDIKQSGLALKCIVEIYKKFEVPLEYSTLLFKKLDQMKASTRTANLNFLLKSDPHVVSQIKLHAIQCTEIDDNKRLTILLSTTSFEAKASPKNSISISLLESAIHAWDYEVRMSAIQLICGQFTIDTETRSSLLKEAIPRVFIYCDAKFSNPLERCLDSIVRSYSSNQNSYIKLFLEALMNQIQPLLRPHQSGVKKSYIISLIKTIWRTLPLYLFSKKLFKQLIHGLFESSYVLRDQFFTLLLFIIRTCDSHNPEALKIVKRVLNKDRGFIDDLVNKNKESPRFRESDGASRLAALIEIVQNDNPIAFVSTMWKEFLSGNPSNESIPSHFPLSAILHVLKRPFSNKDGSGFFINELLPNLVQLINDSLQFMSVQTDVAAIPIQNIKNDLPESELNTSINKSWLVVRQSLNIITCIINHYFDNIPKDLVLRIGNSLFNFLVESRHFSTVYYAHLTFQSLCTRCFIREDLKKLPETWTDCLIQTADNFSSADHKASNGFVQTATALIHSEPSNLFGSQQSIYYFLQNFCSATLAQPTTDNKLRSALLLAEAMAKDAPTQANFEPYSSQLLVSAFITSMSVTKYEMKCTANHCLASLLLRHCERGPKEDSEYVFGQNEFFQSVHGIYDFFSEHLSPDQSDIAYVILQVILIMKPFPQEVLFGKIADLKLSSYSHVRRAAARAILIVIPPNLINNYISQCLNELIIQASLPTSIAHKHSPKKPLQGLIKNNTNLIDGILLQIQQLCREFPQSKEHVLPLIEDICKQAISQHITDYIQIYTVISLAREFNCLSLLHDMLLSIFRNRKQFKLMERPLGHQILRATFSVLTEEDKEHLLVSNDFATIFHLIIHLNAEQKEITPKINKLLVDLYLNDSNQAISDYLPTLLSSPTKEQKRKFLEILSGHIEDARFVSMLNLTPIFVTDAIPVLNNFVQYAQFVDRCDSGALMAISKMTLHYHEQLFTTFRPENLTIWKIALRILSDDNPSVRCPCCRALSFHLRYKSTLINLRRTSSANQNENETRIQLNHIDLCEFDLIENIYRLMINHRELLECILREFKEFKEEEGETHFKKEPTPFLHPPSFHVRLIKRIMKEIDQRNQSSSSTSSDSDSDSNTDNQDKNDKDKDKKSVETHKNQNKTDKDDKNENSPNTINECVDKNIITDSSFKSLEISVYKKHQNILL